MNTKEELIIIYHVPVDGMPKQKAMQSLVSLIEAYKSDDFFKQYFCPYKGGNLQKIIIETINIKDSKTEKVESLLENLDNTLEEFLKDYK
jgi:hypothetical protein